MLVALAMPVLIGGTGFAVDTAQWYMWKRELQFATDQGAIAAAWALTDTDTKGSYQTRATQAYDNNLATTADYATAPTIQLSDYNGGSSNSVIVSASVTRELPFSSIITGSPTTVAVSSQAQFSEGKLIYSCILSTSEHDSGAINLGGSSVITAGCGMAALSDSPTAITVDGTPNVEVGTISAAGGVDPYLAENNTVQQNLGSGVLDDPYKDLSPPNPVPNSLQTSPADSCAGTGKNKIAAMEPGTYSDFTLKCDTTMDTGVYVIDGGTVSIPSQYMLTGNGVMFVLKNGAGIQINGGSDINLTSMSSGQILAHSDASADEADKLAGMLIYEDPNSEGNTGDKINGTASTVLNGTVYLPKSNLDFLGTASVTSQCLMLATLTLHISGNANMTSFCPPDGTSSTVVGSTSGTVKLVA